MPILVAVRVPPMNSDSSKLRSNSQYKRTHGTGIVGYNVQTAVDTEHHLIVEQDVVNEGVDRSQLSGMAKKARSTMGVDDLTVIANRGYFKSEEILACHEAGITAIVPKTVTSIATAGGQQAMQTLRITVAAIT